MRCVAKGKGTSDSGDQSNPPSKRPQQAHTLGFPHIGPRHRVLAANGCATPVVAPSHSYPDRVRVWELAGEMNLGADTVIEWLRVHGHWATSHLNVVPDTHLDAARSGLAPLSRRTPTSASALGPPQQPEPQPSTPAPEAAARQPRPRPGTRPPLPRRRRRPGPRPVTYQQPWTPEDDDDDYYTDPREELRYLPVLSTRDVAELCEVTTATVRQWVTRGYLTPIGRTGPSNIFATQAVLNAAADITRRRKHRGKPAGPAPRRTAPPGVRSRGTRVSTVELHRLARVYPQLVLDTSGAAGLLGIKPATIRSWVRRGHLRPLPTSTRRHLEFRLADLLGTLGHHHI